MNSAQKLKEYMNENKKDIYNEIKEYTNFTPNTNEATFRTSMAKKIEEIASDLNIDIKVYHEYTVLKGRIDSLYGRVNLEYKKPGNIKSNNSHRNNQSYIEEVQKQINGLAKDDKIEKNSILGIIFDGKHIIYVQYLNNDWSISKPIQVTPDSLKEFFVKLYSLSMDKAVSIKNLVNDFGFTNPDSLYAIKSFYFQLKDNEVSASTDLLFDEWRSLFREVTGYSFSTNKSLIDEIKSYYIDEEVESFDLDKLIFSIHTFYALITKLLTSNILHHYSSSDLSFANNTSEINSENLFKKLEEIESGGTFKKLGINNFLEGDFFGWYLYEWNNDISNSILRIVEIFNEYNYATVNLDEHNTRDLLKNLYHHLFSKKLRHALGEYYTPDWLAELTYEKLGINGDITKSILDPCVGSGTFCVIAIKNAITQNSSMNKKELLNNILKNIKGYDLNPLAVISARANYIISLADLISETDQPIEIPIYLCDSMLTILEQNVVNHKSRVLVTKVGSFTINDYFVKNNSTSKLTDLLLQALNHNKDFETIIPQISNEFSIDQHEDKEYIVEDVYVLYNELSKLKENGLHNIWGQIIKNAFAPLQQNRVDFIIGNPPWINWQTLPEDYRESIHKYWSQYKIFEHKGLQARLGSAHDDISVLLTYVVMDNFLKKDGKLGFVINQNLLQASGGGQGFRKFKIKDIEDVEVIEVDDFVDVKPFAPFASNKTAVIFMKKGSKTNYPVKYYKWSKLIKGNVDIDDTLSSVKDKLSSNLQFANPIYLESGKINSPWIINDINKLEEFKYLLGSSNYIARKGVDTSANGIYWVKIINEARGRFIIENSPESSRKDIPLVDNFPIEKELIYPLVRGKDIQKWRYKLPLNIVVPYHENMKEVYTKQELYEKYPLTYKYFYNHYYSKEFIEILLNRATYKKHYGHIYKGEAYPEYVLYNIGSYTSAPFKVIWKALQQKGMAATVISSSRNKLIIPDHNLLMIPLYNEEEAYYVAAVLNSEIVGEFIDSYISWFKSSHILSHIKIPEFIENNSLHKELATLSKKAHDLMSINNYDDRSEIEYIEKTINEKVVLMFKNNFLENNIK